MCILCPNVTHSGHSVSSKRDLCRVAAVEELLSERLDRDKCIFACIIFWQQAPCNVFFATFSLFLFNVRTKENRFIICFDFFFNSPKSSKKVHFIITASKKCFLFPLCTVCSKTVLRGRGHPLLRFGCGLI